MVYKVKKEKSPITIVAEMVDKNYAYVLNFINNHPEFGIVKDKNNVTITLVNKSSVVAKV